MRFRHYLVLAWLPVLRLCSRPAVDLGGRRSRRGHAHNLLHAPDDDVYRKYISEDMPEPSNNDGNDDRFRQIQVKELEQQIDHRQEAAHEELEERESHTIEEDAEQSDHSFGFLVAGTLVSFLVFSMYLLYMTQNSDPQVSAYSSKTLSMSLGIFLAIMSKMAQTHLVCHYLVMVVMAVEDLDETTVDEIVTALVGFAWYFGMTALCFLYKDNNEDLACIQVIAMHLAVFVAIDSLSELQEYVVLKQGSNYYYKALAYFAVPPIALVGCHVLGFASSAIRDRLLDADGAAGHGHDGHGHGHDGHGDMHDEHHGHGHGDHGQGHDDHGHEHDEHRHGHHPPHWVHISMEIEAEYSGLLFGFLFVRALMFVCTATMQGDKFDLGYTRSAIEGAWMNMLICIVLSIGAFLATTKLDQLAPGLSHHQIETIEVHAQFVVSWLILNFTYYVLSQQFHQPTTPKFMNGETVQMTYMAFVMAPLLVIGIIGIDMAGDRHLINDFTANELVECISLATGLLWEHAFHASVLSLAGAMGYEKTDHQKASGIASLLVVMTVFPAWKWYILPPSLKEVEKRSSLKEARPLAQETLAEHQAPAAPAENERHEPHERPSSADRASVAPAASEPPASVEPAADRASVAPAAREPPASRELAEDEVEAVFT